MVMLREHDGNDWVVLGFFNTRKEVERWIDELAIEIDRRNKGSQYFRPFNKREWEPGQLRFKISVVRVRGVSKKTRKEMVDGHTL